MICYYHSTCVYVWFSTNPGDYSCGGGTLWAVWTSSHSAHTLSPSSASLCPSFHEWLSWHAVWTGPSQRTPSHTHYTCQKDKTYNVVCRLPLTTAWVTLEFRYHIIEKFITGPSKSTSEKKYTLFFCFSLTWRALQQCAIWRASTSLSSSCSISHRPGTGRALGLSAYSCAAAGLSLQRNSYHSYNGRTKGVKPLCGKIRE